MLFRSLLLIACLAGVAACAPSLPPRELVNARDAYRSANSGPAPNESPVALHEAKLALDMAEREWSEQGDSLTLKALSTVAAHKAQMASEAAEASLAAKRKEVAEHDTAGGQTDGRSTATIAPAAAPAPVQPAQKPVAAPAADDIAFSPASPQAAAFALVIGIEHYRDLPAPDGARLDAERFATLLKRTLGLREQNVHLITDERATRTDITGQLDWLKSTVTAGSRVYFYFSGHGAPDIASGAAFLLPYDTDTKRISSTGISMSEIARVLSETRARDALAIVDSCFSGAGGRSVLPPGARPLVRMKETAPTAKLALFSAAAGDEISGPRPGAHEGLFTRIVTEGLATGAADGDGDGQVSLAELSSWVTPRVAREAKRDSREQHPQLVVGAGADAPGNFIVAYGYAGKR